MELTWDQERKIESSYARMVHSFNGKNPPILQHTWIFPKEVKLWYPSNGISVMWIEEGESKVAHITNYSRGNFQDIVFELKYAQREGKSVRVGLVLPKSEDDVILLYNIAWDVSSSSLNGKKLKSLASLAYIALIKQNNIYAPNIKVSIVDEEE